MQDVIIKLTETEKSNDTITMIVSQKKDLKNKYMDQVEYNNRLQSENENLKRQILELSDLSFARNGAAFMSASGSVRRVDGPGGMIDGNLEDPVQMIINSQLIVSSVEMLKDINIYYNLISVLK